MANQFIVVEDLIPATNDNVVFRGPFTEKEAIEEAAEPLSRATISKRVAKLLGPQATDESVQND